MAERTLTEFVVMIGYLGDPLPPCHVSGTSFSVEDGSLIVWDGANFGQCIKIAAFASGYWQSIYPQAPTKAQKVSDK